MTKLSLNNEVSGYSVLPSAGEYTATGGGNPDIRGVDYVGDPLLLPEIYVAPGVYGEGKEGAMALVLSVDYRMGTPDKVYRIELYNPDLDQSDKDYYNIRRNTIYRVFATLKGPGNMEYDIVVDEWEDTEVAIPW